jgi:hypothetical protein
MPVKWTRKQISSETFESAGVFDVDGDGILDIVSGAFWYKGPDFRRKILICDTHRRYQDYYDDFSTIAMDIDGDGKLDFITGGWWGETLRWLQNPGVVPSGWGSAMWTEHSIAAGIGNIETTRAWDIDGDGHREIVPNTPGAPLCAYKLVRDLAGLGTGVFSRHELFPRGLGHGLGFGDIDGDGRNEFITPAGILKSPADPLGRHWELQKGPDIGSDASIPVLVVDINDDGINELIVGNSHSYGLSWWQRQGADWIRHAIDPFNSQYHDLHWADIDGDGMPELITGKRYLAHCGNDPGEYDDIGIYYFKWTGEGFAKHIITHGPLGVGAGCGIQFALADLRGTGRLDIIAPGKDGLHIFFNDSV